jgi:LEA14-like dessication related protein
MSLEKKFLAYVAVGAIVILIAAIAVLPNSDIIKNLIPHGPNVPTSLTAISTQIKPISIQYNGSSITSVSNRDAAVQTNFYITNPNNTTVILESINYDIYANGVVIGHGQLGERYEGSWQSSNYFPLVQGTSTNMSNRDMIENTGNNPDIWSALQMGTAKLTVAGTAYYATKNAFSGQDFSTAFDFTKS